MFFLFKTLIQFCNFTFSLIGTSHTFYPSTFPLRLDEDILYFKDLKPDTPYNIILQKNNSVLGKVVRTTEGGKCNINLFDTSLESEFVSIVSSG
jgi:hypothetical protein